MLYICPKCHENLNRKDNSYICNNNHLYDISSKGYVNFLLNNDKSSLNPGDSKESLIARNNYLKKGYYSFILDKVKMYLENKSSSLLDIGCGEGYYTYSLKQEYPLIDMYAFDISKDGIMLASKYSKNDINWFVSNSKNIPIKDHSIDYVLAMFSFLSPSEIERVIKKDGIIIQVCSGKNHLIELREKIYGDLKDKDQKNILLPFNLIESNNFTNKIKIDNNEDIINLFKMTPHYYRTSQESKDKILKLNEIELTIDIIVNIYKVI